MQREQPDPAPASLVGGSGSEASQSVWAFGTLAAANLATAFYLNTRVLTDDVYRALLAGRGSASQIDALLSVTHRFELLGYAFGPLTLLVRIGLVALLVQLALVLLGPRPPLWRVFRASTLAQYALLLGTVAQILRLALLAPSARTSEQLQAATGALGGFFGLGGAPWPGLMVLLERVTIFDVGWMVLFILALEQPGRIRGPEATAAVVSVWILCTLTQWGFWLYFTGPA